MVCVYILEEKCHFNGGLKKYSSYNKKYFEEGLKKLPNGRKDIINEEEYISDSYLFFIYSKTTTNLWTELLLRNTSNQTYSLKVQKRQNRASKLLLLEFHEDSIGQNV